MLLTEEQARRRFCPKMVVVSEDGLSHSNRWGNDIFDQAAAKRGDHAAPLNCCIASDCMAWRWHDLEHQTHTKLHRDGTDPAIPPGGDGWEAAIEDEDGVLWRRINQDRRGFCGLAGTVEG